MIKSLLILSLIIFISGCSSKKYFEPNEKEVEVKEFNSKYTGNGSLENMNRVGGTFYEGKIVSKKGIEKLDIKEDKFKFLNLYNNKIIASNYRDKLLIDQEIIKTKNPVVAASIQGNLLALLYTNNTVELKTLDSKETLFKEYLPLSIANDTRIINPYFMEKIVLFPTLDGKLLIVSLETKKIVKDIIVDAKGQFNNPIFLKLVGNTLITATANRILTIHKQTLNSKDYEIRDVIMKDEFIYIATIDGQLIKLNLQLQELKRTKFKYAKFYTLSSKGDSIYALESQGYLIKLTTDLKQTNIYKFEFDNDNRVLAIDDKLYFDMEYITLP